MAHRKRNPQQRVEGASSGKKQRHLFNIGMGMCFVYVCVCTCVFYENMHMHICVCGHMHVCVYRHMYTSRYLFSAKKLRKYVTACVLWKQVPRQFGAQDVPGGTAHVRGENRSLI